MKKQRGFTLIELLVVIAIIGLLSTLAVVALNNARQKARDARRVSDVKQIQTALELYYNDENGYPDGSAVGQEVDSGTDLLGPTSAVTYMSIIPTNPSPGGSTYTYTRQSASTYSLTYTLEGPTGGLATGAHSATPAGIDD